MKKLNINYRMKDVMKKLLIILLLISSVSIWAKEDEKDNPSRRFEEFAKEREYPKGYIPDNARVKAFQQMESIMHEKNSPAMQLALQPEWTNIGPFDIGGRIKSIVIHPTNSDTAYAGAAAGGIWKTVNGGQKWDPIFDFENAIAFGSLSMDPENTAIIYAGTGEAVNSSTAYLGSGIYKTTNSGNTWKLIGLSFVGAFSKVIVHPKNSNLIYAGAVRRGKGLYRSQDAGVTWEKMSDKNVTDVSINPNDENEVLIGVSGEGVYCTKNGGISWTLRNDGFEAGLGRISVQIAPSDPKIAYALVETNGLGYIYKTTNLGVNWGNIYKGDAAFFNNQGFYDNYIAIHPKRSDVVLAGGIDIWRTINGIEFENITNGYTSNSKMHVDQHCATFFLGNPNVVYVGNDGGVYSTSDVGQNWTAINNNLQVTQFYSIGIDPSAEKINYGGTQDNGTVGIMNALGWNVVVGGDGFRTIVDISNSSVIYGASTPGGRITPYKYDVKSGNFQYLTQGLNTADGVWDPPFVQHPTLPDVLMHGRTKLYASYGGGDQWTALPTGITQGRFTAIAMSVADENALYAGTSNGEVVVSRDVGETWANVTDNGLVNRWVKDMACSNEDPASAFIVYSGFGTPHVYKTTNYGKSWFSISNGLPDIPVNAIEIHPDNGNMIFIATDIGVFATFDGGDSWFPYGRGLARAPATDLAFNKYYMGQTTQYLRVATHGRSIWEVPVTVEKITSPEINTPAGGELYTSTTNQVITWYGFTSPVKVEYSVNDGVNWNPIANNVQGTSINWSVPNLPTFHARVRVSSLTDLSQVRISNSFTIFQVASGSIMTMGGVNYVLYGLAWDGKDGLWTTSFYSNIIAKLNAKTYLKEKEFKLPGDSLFTDIAFDKDKGIMYIHRMGTIAQGGGVIFTVDTNGLVLNEFKSPADVYPIGLEFVDGKLIVGDRDKKDSYSNKNFFVVNPATGATEKTINNSCQITYGPRGLAYDGQQYVYQVCTFFPNAGPLDDAYIQKIDKNNLSKEVSRLNLESLDGIINARGIDYDGRDENFWVTDFSGNIYKVAGFNIQVGVDETITTATNELLEVKIYPNPISDFGTVSFKMLGMEGNLKITLTDMLGRNISDLYDKQLTINQADMLTFNTNNLTSGVYNLCLSVDGRHPLVRQIVLMK